MATETSPGKTRGFQRVWDAVSPKFKESRLALEQARAVSNAAWAGLQGRRPVEVSHMDQIRAVLEADRALVDIRPREIPLEMRGPLNRSSMLRTDADFADAALYFRLRAKKFTDEASKKTRRSQFEDRQKLLVRAESSRTAKLLLELEQKARQERLRRPLS